MAQPENRANSLFSSLTSDLDIVIPEIDFSNPLYTLPGGEDNSLYNEITPLSNDDLTTKEIDGSGTFDTIMSSLKLHLQEEYDKGRITGSEYTKAYIALTESALNNAVQYLVQRDAAYWNAITAQIAAITGVLGIENAKVQYASLSLEAKRIQAEYARSKMGLATADAEYNIQQYNLSNILPSQDSLVKAQTAGQTTQNQGYELDNDTKSYLLANTLPAEFRIAEANELMIRAQKQEVEAQTDTISYNLANILPEQKNLLVEQVRNAEVDKSIKDYNLTAILPAQMSIAKEQAEAQRAQTMDVRIDGNPVQGLIGGQKALHEQQIISYQRDGEVKAAKMFADAWVVQKTIDEGLTPPASFANPSVDSIMSSIKTKNGL